MTEETKTISFQRNWNNKLDCLVFTTFRIPSKKYQVGEVYQIELSGIVMGKAICKDIKYQYLDKVDEYLFRLDMGMSKQKGIEMLTKMYPNVNFMMSQIAIILLKYEKEGDKNG